MTMLILAAAIAAAPVLIALDAKRVAGRSRDRAAERGTAVAG